MARADKNKDKKKAANNTQGFSEGRNALYRIVAMATAIALLPAIVGLGFLFALREPALEADQIQRISSAMAQQQATNLNQMITRLGSRLEGAARSPLALSAIASQVENDLEVVEKAMLDYFPEVISLRIIPIGEMGTANFADGNQGLRNHIEVDLVRRTAGAEQTQPESYRFENRWLTSLAYLVAHPRIADRKAVIIATLNNEHIGKQMQMLDTSIGKFTLQQSYTSASGVRKLDEVAAAGSGTGDYNQLASIPNTRWQVMFTPSQELLSQLAVSGAPTGAVILMVVFGILAAMGMIVFLYRRVLKHEVERIISFADKKTPAELQVPELVGLAMQLRRTTQRNLRQTTPPPESPPVPEVSTISSNELSNPMFQSTGILVEEEIELELPEAGAELEIELVEEDPFPRHIFRAYDIRGLGDSELDDDTITAIGSAIGTLAHQRDEQTIIVGGDGRLSTPRIKATLIRALMESGRDVIDIGTVPTPLLYFATQHLDCKSAVMVTGSHNPAEYNGLKIVLDQQTIAAGGIQEIRAVATKGNFARGSGRMIREDIIEAYIDEVVGDVAVAVPMKIVIDAGNGATGPIAPMLFEELGCEVIPMYCELDGTFPHHSPDTSNEANLADLAARVVREQADFGVAFDGDGDRLAVVTGSGEIIRSDTLLMLFAQDVVSRNPGADVVFDVKCSRNLTQLITQHGGRPVLWKTGHAFMKQKMAETGALLGGEFSGHIFFGERWYGYDDGMYAAGRLAEILSTGGDSLDEEISRLPNAINTPELLISVPEADKFDIIARLVDNAEFDGGKINTLDGIRVDFAEGWGLLRASNTTAALTARFEASNEDTLEQIKSSFRDQLAQIEPDLSDAF